MFELRPYQSAAVAAVEKEWAAGRQKTLLVLVTGAGKTVIASNIIKHQVDKGNKVLFLAHRGELLEQAQDKMSQACGITSALEKAESTAVGKDCSVVVASVQTLYQDKRLEAYSPDYFDVIVIDEAHHCMSDTYQKVLNYFKSPKILGMTATPDRSDKRNLGMYFDSLAYEYGIREAVDNKYLCSPSAQLIPLKLDISNVSVNNGDFAAGELGTALDPYLEEIANEMVIRCAGRKIACFLPLVKTSQKFKEILDRKGFKAVEVNGNSPDRKEKLQAFSRGDFNVILNSMLLTEGWDEPAVDCIVMLRPTKSRSLYQQVVGRGLRLSEGKKDCLILDFLWLTARHDLCHPASIIAKDEEMAKRMTEKLIIEGAKGNNGAISLLNIEAAVEQDIIREREESLARQLAEMRCKRASLVDPLQYAFSIADENIINYEPSFEWERKTATQKQLDLISAWGLDVSGIDTVGKASAIINALHDRKRRNLATPKQIRLLENKGFKKVGTWTFKEASDVIGIIAANRWAVPKWINASTYKPSQSNNNSQAKDNKSDNKSNKTPKVEQLRLNI